MPSPPPVPWGHSPRIHPANPRATRFGVGSSTGAGTLLPFGSGRWTHVEDRLRVLALDYGERRVGVALSDPTGTFAQPLETLRCRGVRDASLYARIVARIKQHEVSRIVVGLPLHMDGRRGPEALTAEAFGTRLAEESQVPVEYMDERWTTLEARRTFTELGVRRERAKQRIDAVAACLILRTWLDREAGARAR